MMASIKSNGITQVEYIHLLRVYGRVCRGNCLTFHSKGTKLRVVSNNHHLIDILPISQSSRNAGMYDETILMSFFTR